jgi:hypothetical protein
MSYFYKILISACLALAFKIALVPDFPSVIALVSFVAAGLGVFFVSDNLQKRHSRFESAIQTIHENSVVLVKAQDRLAKLEAHVERVDNRTRPPGR